MGGGCKLAFTLAEVLIVLGIIGLIADMTIPTLVQKTQEKITVIKLKKTYSTLSAAYKLATIENGTIDEWGLGAGYGNSNPQGNDTLLNTFAKYMKFTRICKAEIGSTCWRGAIYHLDGTYYDTPGSNLRATGFLKDGSLLDL